MRISKAILAVMFAVICSVIGWGVSVESRLAQHAEALNLSNRIRALEELMLPMLIDWKTHKELRKWQKENIDKIRGQVTAGDESPVVSTPEKVPDAVRRNVDDWARGVFKDPDKKSE